MSVQFIAKQKQHLNNIFVLKIMYENKQLVLFKTNFQGMIMPHLSKRALLFEVECFWSFC